MRRNDPVAEVRGKDSAELVYDLNEARKALFHTKVQSVGESTDTMQSRTLRRKIARILTVLTARDSEAAQSGAKSEES
ncbi:MAG: 50S ribosomal protein L29 [Planctomycetes bacterium]|jgi:ribosomal protein L29|nr:50S ribosomal protein L29 [Planctomycetota bacterium]